MVERDEFERPEDRIFLTVDFDGNFMDLLHIAQDFNDKIHSVKLGQGFLLDERANKLRQRLLEHRTSLYLDTKYRDDPDQMAYQVKKAGELGFKLVSVSPSAGVDSLVAAGYGQNGIQVVTAFSTDEEMNRIEMRNVRDANAELESGYKLEMGMCNVSCIERIKSLGNFSVIATGIRMPGDEIDDQPAVATPAEALQRGADRLAIGRAITAKRDKLAAFDKLLENIVSVA